MPVQYNIAIFDGDNTIWDTNEVFTLAQKNILSSLKINGFPADPEGDFQTLREVDDLLIAAFSGKREYPIEFLALSLIHKFSGTEVNNVDDVQKIINSDPSKHLDLAKSIEQEFILSLKTIPKLLPGAIEAFERIALQGRTLLVLYSEGRQSRLEAICEYYGMKKHFHCIFIDDKSIEGWNRIKSKSLDEFQKHFQTSSGPTNTIFVIGDLLNVDIKNGNLIGATTIYKPGGYKGFQTPTADIEKPVYSVSSFKEVADIICHE